MTRFIMTGRKKVYVDLDLTSFDQVKLRAAIWGVAPGAVLAECFRACLPALKVAGDPQSLFAAVRDALEQIKSRSEGGPEC